MGAITTREKMYRAIEKALGYADGDVIAVKIWTRGDIESQLEEVFDVEEPTKDMIDAVLCENKIISGLEDCDDSEWELIDNAIEASGVLG